MIPTIMTNSMTIDNVVTFCVYVSVGLLVLIPLLKLRFSFFYCRSRERRSLPMKVPLRKGKISLDSAWSLLKALRVILHDTPPPPSTVTQRVENMVVC